MRKIGVIIVVLFITVPSALASMYTPKLSWEALMYTPKKVSCKIAPVCMPVAGMKALHRNVYYYDQNGNLRLKLKSIWVHKQGR